MPAKLDAIDQKILRILQANAKITNAQLSQEIGLSPAPTLERVKKLEKTGVIKSYHAALDQQVSVSLLLCYPAREPFHLLGQRLTIPRHV